MITKTFKITEMKGKTIPNTHKMITTIKTTAKSQETKSKKKKN